MRATTVAWSANSTSPDLLFYVDLHLELSRGNLTKFHSVLKSFMQEYKPSIVVLVEPKIYGPSAEKAIKRIGLARSHRVEAHGFSGGIWLLWKEEINLVVLSSNFQFIHARVTVHNTPKSFDFVAVYASPNPQIRQSLWCELSPLITSNPFPMILAGDFNATLFSDERRGASVHRFTGCPRFSAFVHNSGLIDMGFCGPTITWRRGLKFARLDQPLTNQKWIQDLPLSQTHHLAQVKSDHRPLLIDLGLTFQQARKPSPFKFLAAWTTHDSFNGLIRDSWDPNTTLAQNLQSLTETLSTWNKDVFGLIGKRKRHLRARILGIQTALEARPLSIHLNTLDKQLRDDYETTCWQEELLWRQKATCDWICQGDRNTKYYRMKAKIRQRTNRIRALQDDTGAWILDEESLTCVAKSYFNQLYTSDSDHHVQYHTSGKFPLLSSSSLFLI